MPEVNVKWGAKKLSLNVNPDQEPLVFKSQLFELTGVIPDRQKVIFKVILFLLTVWLKKFLV